MSARKTTKAVTKAMIYRSVASSSAIETGESTEVIERKLEDIKRRFAKIDLARD
ncbi:hypothetical protein [Pseudoalteromonas rubra]|uniref:hypothetical protein n=1 Tax=Pseudoalteromonas rubra TaxID=43658 RepID=UPI000B22C46E|nr:hypothetical protein [Pseudoalteromonas rubra]